MTDALQVILSQSGWMLYASCLVLVLAVWQALRLAGLAVRALLQVSILHRPGKWITAALIALPVFWLSAPICAGLEWLEDRYLSPVYLSGHVGEEDAVEAYEREIRKHTSAAEFDTLKRRTAEIASKINSRPIAIYETAWLECSLNPFRVRDDHVAAGWIQFTRAGLSGIGVSLDSVIRACRARDIATIMNLTDAYLTRRWEKAGRPDMSNTIDLYLAVFAPAHIGRSADQVVYHGFDNPAYFKNSGLDGWTVDGGKIVRGRKDGRITVREIWLCLERKKGVIFKK